MASLCSRIVIYADDPLILCRRERGGNRQTKPTTTERDLDSTNASANARLARQLTPGSRTSWPNLCLDTPRGWGAGRVMVFHCFDCGHWFRLHPMYRPVTRMSRHVCAQDVADFVSRLVVANRARITWM